MDRQIVYVGAVPLDTDQLLQSRNTMVALGYLAKMTIGDGGVYADGLGCTPGSGLTVTIGPGSMTLPTVVDAGYYGALPPDGDPVVKTGINTAPIVVSLPGTGTTVISGSVVEVQAGSSALAYYNAANPGQTLFGVQGNGQAQASILQQRVVFAATTPSAVPAGYTALWQIVVPASATVVDPSADPVSGLRRRADRADAVGRRCEPCAGDHCLCRRGNHAKSCGLGCGGHLWLDLSAWSDLGSGAHVGCRGKRRQR